LPLESPVFGKILEEPMVSLDEPRSLTLQLPRRGEEIHTCRNRGALGSHGQILDEKPGLVKENKSLQAGPGGFILASSVPRLWCKPLEDAGGTPALPGETRGALSRGERVPFPPSMSSGSTE
jgi:hypothetical protein